MSIRKDIALNRIPVSPNISLLEFEPLKPNRSKKFKKPQKEVQARGSAASIEHMYYDNGFDEVQQTNYAEMISEEILEEDDETFIKLHMRYGNAHSNDNVEQNILKLRKANREKKLLEKQSQEFNSHGTSMSSLETASSSSSSSCPDILTKNLSKNIAFTGLLKQNIINLSDLSINPRKSKSKKLRNRHSKNKCDNEGVNTTLSRYVEVGVPHPEEPDVLIHRFLTGEGAPEVPGIDYTVDRLAIRTVITPRKQLMEMSDDDFKFVKH